MLGGLDYHSIAMAVRRALGTVGTTMGSLTVTGFVNGAGTKGDLLTGNGTTMVNKAAGADGYFLRPSSANTDGMAWVGPGMAPWNGTLTATQNATVLTVSIKTHAVADPSDADPVFITFRSATSKTGDATQRKLNAANTLSTTVAGTFGVANNVPFKLWIVAFDDGGTVRLGLINCLTTAAGAGAGRDVSSIYPLAQFGIASSTQIGAGSTSAGVFYTAGAAVASKPYVVLGYLSYESGLAAAGTFAVDQSKLDLYRAGNPLPGQTIQVQTTINQAMTTTATILPLDDTIPQSGEGAQTATVTITPGSAANVLRVETQENFASDAAAGVIVGTALFQDATANALRAGKAYNGAASNWEAQLGLRADLLAAGTAATTFKSRVGPGSANTVTINGRAAARDYGGVLTSWISAAEIMG